VLNQQICVGPLAAPIGVEGNAFVASAMGNLSWPDLQITFISSHPGFDGGTGYADFLGIDQRVSRRMEVSVFSIVIAAFSPLVTLYLCSRE
jgi:hypothetical protein